MGLITRILSGDPRIFPYLARTDTLPRNICLLRSLRPRGTICGTGFHARHPAPRGQHWVNRVGEVLAMDKGAEDGLLWMSTDKELSHGHRDAPRRTTWVEVALCRSVCSSSLGCWFRGIPKGML